MKIALVHDYLTQRGGAERVFELLCKHFPEADVYTSVYNPEETIDLDKRLVQTSFLQNLPGSSRHFRLFAPLYFEAFRRLDLREYDLIITSTSSFAKAVQKRPDAHHICFCHNVTRFLWDTTTYLKEYKKFGRFSPVLEMIFQYMRSLDLNYSQAPDLYIANSSTVAHRIQAIYDRPAVVINYPIDINKFSFSDQKEEFYLVSSRLMGYKRIDVVIEAFNWLGLPLLIAGDGPERERLEGLALENVQFLGYISDVERSYLMSRACCVIVAALEDYGLVPIEANASGTPVISFGAGGVLDTQVPGMTGLFFNRQTPDSLQRTLLDFQKIQWDYGKVREHVLNRFTEEVFFERVDSIIRDVLEGKLSNQGAVLTTQPFDMSIY